MAVVVGSVGVPGSTGNFSVTGLPFQPVAVILFNQHNHLGDVSHFLGCATASDEQWVVWAGSRTQTSGYLDRKYEARDDRCCLSYTTGAAGTVAWACSFVSFNSDGFTLNLTDRTAVSAGEGGNIYYMALGGAHISEAHAGTFDAGASTGTVSVTDPGFEPTCAIFAHSGGAAFNSGPAAGYVFATGVTDGISQFGSFVLGGQGADTGPVAHITRTNAIACYYDSVQDFVMEWDSWDANGFTVDVTNAVATLTHGYLAINAEGAVAGNDIQPDANTTLTYATPGLLPEGVFFCWPGVDAPSSTGSTTGILRPGVGAGTISQQRMSAGLFRVTGSFGVWTSDGFQIATEPMGFWGTGTGIGGGDNLSQASADISAMVEESFDLTWTSVADTNDRAFGWLALPGEVLGRWVPHIYRRVSG